MAENKHRIAYALQMSGWIYGEDKKEALIHRDARVTPEEFDIAMKGNIFCPICTTPLARCPEIAAITTNSRTAHFKHKPTYEKVQCILKTKKMGGFNYETEEDAAKAIEDESLVIISDWMDSPPAHDYNMDGNGEFNQTAIEDEDGPLTNVAIGRHRTKEFKLPSRISSVTTLCKDFDKNLHRGYHFPGSQYPMLLSALLFDTERVTTNLILDTFKKSHNPSRLFFGKIVKYGSLTNVNVIHLENKIFGYFKIYTKEKFDRRKYIGSGSVGRYILFYSELEWRAEMPQCRIYSWGRYSLIPKKHEKYLLKYKKQ